jgi:hypothetical protein
MKRMRLFSSHLTRGERRVYGAVVAFYVLATLGMIWPGYVPFSGARPLVLGLPLSLFYLACFVVASFVVLLALYRWEIRREERDDR